MRFIFLCMSFFEIFTMICTLKLFVQIIKLFDELADMNGIDSTFQTNKKK